MAIEEERGGGRKKITLQLLALLFGLLLPLAVELCVWQEGRRRAKDPIFSPPSSLSLFPLFPPPFSFLGWDCFPDTTLPLLPLPLLLHSLLRPPFPS